MNSRMHCRWTSKAKISGGLQCGPLVLFDTEDNVVIISPLNNFMAASVWNSGQFYANDPALHWGIMGEVKDIPPNFLYETIVFYSDKGINKVRVTYLGVHRSILLGDQFMSPPRYT